MEKQQKHVVVIGAGLAGLSAAAYLAKNGLKVTVLEKNRQPGGRAYTEKKGRYRFDVGPHWYSLPQVYENFFADFGKKITTQYELKRLDPAYRTFFAGDRAHDISGQIDSAILFSQLEPGASVELERLLADGKKFTNCLVRRYSLGGRGKLLTFLARVDRELAMTGRSHLEKYVRLHVHDPRLKRMLEVKSLFLGEHPKRLPALTVWQNYADICEGVWYPLGGFRKLAASMMRLAKAEGAEVKLRQGVTRIESKNGQLTGVRVGKKLIHCDAVLATCERSYVEYSLLSSLKARPKKLKSADVKQRFSPTALMIMIGLNTKLQNLEHHNFFADTLWEENLDDLYSKRKVTDEPIFYLSIPSKTDPMAAPSGGEAMTAIVPLRPGTMPDKKFVDAMVKKIYLRISDRAQIEVEKYVQVMEVKTARYFQETFNATDGNIFGLAQGFRQMLATKVVPSSRQVKGLYFSDELVHSHTTGAFSILAGQAAATRLSKLLVKRQNKRRKPKKSAR